MFDVVQCKGESPIVPRLRFPPLWVIPAIAVVYGCDIRNADTKMPTVTQQATMYLLSS